MKKRFYLIDGIRGLAIVNMVLFHFLYDVFILYGHQPDWYARTGTFFWQQAICWTFLLISGMVWPLGRKGNLKRGLLLNFWGLVISAVTCVAEPQAAVWFGILNFIGCVVLLMLLHPREHAFIFSVPGRTAGSARSGRASAGGSSGLAVSVKASDSPWISVSGLPVQRLLSAAAMVFSVFGRLLFLPDSAEKPETSGAVFCPDSRALKTGNLEHLDLPDPSAGSNGNLYAAVWLTKTPNLRGTRIVPGDFGVFA